MASVPSSQLGRRTQEVLERVLAGEDVFVTVDGCVVARIARVARQPRWVPRASFLADLKRVQADPGLRADLGVLVPETTDDQDPL